MSTVPEPTLKRNIIRSILFSIAFTIVTGVMCVIYLLLLPLPRKIFLSAIEFWVSITAFLERTILNLHYEVRGLEHLPTDGAYIIAAKHQSTYETFKLHRLFRDPAIILKQELLKIPLWGLYLKKAAPIAIDRSSPEQARTSINQGALRVKAQGRPIIIFPQGTRVRPETTPAEKPYKSGIAGIQEASNLPIVPMALNTGTFWPRGSLLKSSGTVIFEFLDPIQPGHKKKDLVRMIEERVEAKSKILTDEAIDEVKKGDRKAFRYWFMLFVLIGLLFGIYSYAWIKASSEIRGKYYETLLSITGDRSRAQTMQISGYPGMIHLHVPSEIINTKNGNARLENISAAGWVFPFLPIHIKAENISIKDNGWPRPLTFDTADTTLKIKDTTNIEIADSQLKKDSFIANITGTIDTAQEPIPKLDLSIALKNYQDILGELAKNKIIDTRMNLFLSAGMGGLADDDGVVRIPVVQRDKTLFAGPLPVFKLPQNQ